MRVRCGGAFQAWTRAEALCVGRLAVPVVWWLGLGLFLLLACSATSAFASCPFGIPPETAKRVFDRVKDLQIGDGYKFVGVGTNASRMVVDWSLHDEACPSIRVTTESCTPLFGLPTLALDVPADLLVRCPRLQAVVDVLSAPASPQSAVGVRRRLRCGIGIGLLIAAGLLVRSLLAPAAERRTWRGLGWTVLTLAAVLPFVLADPVAAATVLGAAAWVVFAVLLVDRERPGAESRALRWSLLALFCCALLLNWALSSGGPGTCT